VNFEHERVKAIVAAMECAEGPEKSALEAAAHARTATFARFKRAMSMLLGVQVEVKFAQGKHAPAITFDGRSIPLALLGEGLRRTFAWLSDLLVRLERTPWVDASVDPFSQEFWLILDELDQCIHPSLQRKLLPSLRTLFPNAVIIASTHSPFVVSAAEEGYVFALRPDPKSHMVTGPQVPTKLGPGHSLGWAVEAVFGLGASFQDETTQRLLEAHGRLVDQARTDGAKPDLLAELRVVQGKLRAIPGDELHTIVAIREAPIRKLLESGSEAAE
jgi:AAA domain, putative AbiEii toxin, Type IV TA system